MTSGKTRAHKTKTRSLNFGMNTNYSFPQSKYNNLMDEPNHTIIK